MLISDDYRDENRRMHERIRNYGAYGGRWAPRVRDLAAASGSRTLLDYGCGKGTLAEALPELAIREYDPAIPGKDARPEPADLVVCTDVLEHIEPDFIEEVLDDLASLTRRAAFFNISTRLASKVLEDGRNAHLIVRDAGWWRDRIAARFRIDAWQVEADEVTCVLAPPAAGGATPG